VAIVRSSENYAHSLLERETKWSSVAQVCQPGPLLVSNLLVTFFITLIPLFTFQDIKPCATRKGIQNEVAHFQMGCFKLWQPGKNTIQL